MDEVSIVTKWTSELSEKELDDYIEVYYLSLGIDRDIRKHFQKKYVNNIYGESMHVLAYIGNKCVGTQNYLRSDLCGKRAYHSADSATHPEYRGKGIFSKMAIAGLKELGDGALAYGHPNENSRPAFEKMGWTVGPRRKYKFFSQKEEEQLPYIDIPYFHWMIEDNERLAQWRNGNDLYLIRQRKKNIYFVVGKIDENGVDRDKLTKLRKCRLPVVLMYSESGTVGTGIVSIYGPGYVGDRIPLYKVDTFLI